MNIRPTFAALAATLALAACDSKPATNIVEPIDPMAANVVTNSAVVLPPAIKSAKSYRCKDNSVVYVDLFQGDMQASVRDEANGPRTMLKADEAGKPLIADGGYSLTVKGSTLSLTRPAHGTQSCEG